MSRHPLAISRSELDRYLNGGGILYAPVNAPRVCREKEAERAERYLAYQRAWRKRKRGGKPAMTNSQAGACGGAPQSVTTPEMLRKAWRLIRNGWGHNEAAREAGMNRRTLKYHLRAREGGISRAMKEAIGQ